MVLQVVNIAILILIIIVVEAHIDLDRATVRELKIVGLLVDLDDLGLGLDLVLGEGLLVLEPILVLWSIVEGVLARSFRVLGFEVLQSVFGNSIDAELDVWSQGAETQLDHVQEVLTVVDLQTHIESIFEVKEELSGGCTLNNISSVLNQYLLPDFISCEQIDEMCGTNEYPVLANIPPGKFLGFRDDKRFLVEGITLPE